jgi:hypothetical protein
MFKSVYKVCDKCRRKLYELRFGSNNIYIEEEDDSSDRTDIDSEINTQGRETVMQLLDESLQIVNETDFPQQCL